TKATKFRKKPIKFQSFHRRRPLLIHDHCCKSLSNVGDLFNEDFSLSQVTCSFPSNITASSSEPA
ncbi:hypothetical protein SOVF_120270, partial [Spinacia oleracea]